MTHAKARRREAIQSKIAHTLAGIACGQVKTELCWGIKGSRHDLEWDSRNGRRERQYELPVPGDIGKLDHAGFIASRFKPVYIGFLSN